MTRRWWGPNGFSSTSQAFDLRAGGAWRFVMHGPDYPNESIFVEVVAPAAQETIGYRMRPPTQAPIASYFAPAWSKL